MVSRLEIGIGKHGHWRGKVGELYTKWDSSGQDLWLSLVTFASCVIRSGRGASKLSYTLLHSLRGESHCCVLLVGVSPAQGGRRNAASPIILVERGKQDGHGCTCKFHGFNLVHFLFSTFIALGLEADGLLSCICSSLSLRTKIV